MAVFTAVEQEHISILPLLSLPILLFFLYQYYRYYAKQAHIKKMMKENGCQSPVWYPHLDPFLGYDLVFRFMHSFNAHRLMEDMTEIYRTLKGGANTYCFKAGYDTVITTIEPEIIKSVWVTNEKSYSLSRLRTDNFASVAGRSIFSTNGAFWKESHDFLRPNFSGTQINDLTMFEKHNQNLLTAIHMQGNRVDLQQLFLLLTMDTASERFFGVSTYTLREDGDPKARRFSTTFDKVSVSMSRRQRVGWLATVLPDKDFRQGVEYINDFIGEKVEETIEKRKMMSQKKRDAVDAENERTGRYILADELARSGVSATRIRSELLSIIIAGRDTTAYLLGLFFYNVTRRQDILRKIREEVQREVGEQLPTNAQLGALKYLRCTVNEVLRLYPPISTSGRLAIEDTMVPLGGGPDGKSPVWVPKDTRIFIVPYAMHRREDIWGPDALEFKPERWEDPNLKPGIAFMPFGAGPRVCLGQQLALNTAMYTIVRLLQVFKDIQPGDDTTFEEYMAIAMTCNHGCKVVMTPA